MMNNRLCQIVLLATIIISCQLLLIVPTREDNKSNLIRRLWQTATGSALTESHHAPSRAQATPTVEEGSSAATALAIADEEDEDIADDSEQRNGRPRNEKMPDESAAQMPSNLTQCTHAVLFTAPRHGSTWLVDSIERCRFRKNGKFKKAVQYSELWMPHHAMLANVSVEQALRHLQTQCSIKLFPSAVKRRADVEALVRAARKLGAPMIVLRRSLTSVFLSFRRAQENSKWNLITTGQAREDVVDLGSFNGADFKTFVRQHERFFEGVMTLLESVGVDRVDVLDYDDIRDEEFIVAEKSGCYVHNCNFLESG